MQQQNYVLLFGCVGSGLSAVTELLSSRPNCAVRDIERQLKNNHETRDALRAASPELPDDFTMEDVTYYLPREKVGDLWRDAAGQCLSELEQSSASLKILSGHLVYYSGRRNQFYSTVDLSVLRRQVAADKNREPTGIAVLIDDVYDMYVRLRPTGQLLCDNRIGDFIRSVCDEHKIVPNELDKPQNMSLVLSWMQSSLTRLLSWRNLDITLGTYLGSCLHVPFMVFGAKESLKAVERWLRAPKTYRAYVSHPISEARRQRDKDGHWPPLVDEVNRIQLLLLEHDVIAAMPTVIDEFRLEKKKPGLLQYTGRLLPRWPLLCSPRFSLLYKPPRQGDAPDYYEVLYPGCYNIRRGCLEKRSRFRGNAAKEIRYAVKMLASKLTDQISSRDHLFVSLCEGLFVYRPLYGARMDFSQGVRAEVDHWADLVNSGVRKRCAFVHFEKDVKGCVERRSKDTKDPLSAAVKARLRMFLKEERKLNDREINSLTSSGRLPSGSILDKARRAAGNIEQEYPSWVRQVKTRFLRDLLMANYVHLEEGAVWVLEDAAEFRAKVPEIVSFLKYGLKPTESWQENIDHLLPDSLCDL